MEFLLGVIFPYTAWSVFVSGTILRIVGWLKVPVPFHLTLFPAPVSTADRIATIAWDFLLCSTLFREDKALWLRVWLFHLSLALIIAGHVVGIFFLRDQFVLVGLSPAASQFLSKLLGGISGIVMVLSLGALIIGRIVNPWSGSSRRRRIFSLCFCLLPLPSRESSCTSPLFMWIYLPSEPIWEDSSTSVRHHCRTVRYLSSISCW